MIELTVAASAAFKAYEILKKGLAAGKEIDDMRGQVKSFFRNKQKVLACVQEAEENDKLDSLYAAIDVVTELENLQKIEDKIKWSYIDAGKSMTWQKIVREQKRIESKRAAKAIRANRAAENETELIKAIGLVFVFLVLGLGAAGAILFFILTSGGPDA